MTRIWTGTAEVTSGYTEVTLTGSSPLSDANCPADAQIVLGGATYFVSERVDTQVVELTRPYEGVDGVVSAEIDPMTAATISLVTLYKAITEYDARASLLQKGLFYVTLGVTGANDPGPGYVARDAASWADSTALYFDVLDAGSVDATALIDALSAGSIITVRSVATRGYAAFRLTQAVVAQSGWRSLSNLEYLGGAGTVADGEDVTIEINKAGEGLNYDAHVDLPAGLDGYTGQADGFRVLVSDTGGGEPGLYTLDLSTSPEEWIGPAPVGGLTGEGLGYDVHIETLAERYLYEGQAAGYRVLVSDVGDGRAAIYTLVDGESPTLWAGPAYVTGEQGPAGVVNDALVFQGVIDCSGNPNYPAADLGHTYRVSVAGKIGGASGVNVEVGDLLICLADSTASGNQATVGSSWTISQTNLDGAVIGPASVTDGYMVLFDGSTGKLIKQATGAPGNAAFKNTGTATGTVAAGDDGRFSGIAQNAKSADYTTVLGDAGGHIYHPTTDDNPRTFTIAANASVAYPIGTAITFINDKNTLTIAIASDTLVLAGTGSTGSRTLALYGIATAVKVTSTRWYISGVGLT